VTSARDHVIAQAHVWADQLSADVYASQVAWRLTGDFADLGSVQPDQYFPHDIVHLREGERLVDCGAFTGDTVVEFARRMPAFGGIDAFEPDDVNLVALDAAVNGLGDEVARRVRVHRLATGSRPGTCVFASGRGASSSAVCGEATGEDGDSCVVPCARLDDVLEGVAPTFVKMDIEGAEADTLLGCRRILAMDRPLLAVSAYHRQSDLWELPRLVNELTEDYLLYLRAHQYDGFECVLYGVPNERRM
jgi:FkbM family methyltransferase